MYNRLVHRISRQYSNLLDQQLGIGFPEFSGVISALVPEDKDEELSELQLECDIYFSNSLGVSHTIKLHLHDGEYEAQGIPATSPGITAFSKANQ